MIGEKIFFSVIVRILHLKCLIERAKHFHHFNKFSDWRILLNLPWFIHRVAILKQFLIQLQEFLKLFIQLILGLVIILRKSSLLIFSLHIFGETPEMHIISTLIIDKFL